MDIADGGGEDLLSRPACRARHWIHRVLSFCVNKSAAAAAAVVAVELVVIVSCVMSLHRMPNRVKCQEAHQHHDKRGVQEVQVVCYHTPSVTCRQSMPVRFILTLPCQSWRHIAQGQVTNVCYLKLPLIWVSSCSCGLLMPSTLVPRSAGMPCMGSKSSEYNQHWSDVTRLPTCLSKAASGDCGLAEIRSKEVHNTCLAPSWHRNIKHDAQLHCFIPLSFQQIVKKGYRSGTMPRGVLKSVIPREGRQSSLHGGTSC